MNGLTKMALLCVAAGAATACDQGAKPAASARLDAPLEIQGYRLGMSERAVLEHGEASCDNPPERVDADRICSASTNIAGQPALLFFYFYRDTLGKLTLTILPQHGQLPEVNRIFSEEFATKYGKPSSDSTLAAIWSHGGSAIVISRGDERTMAVNLVSGEYENEKARRVQAAGRGVAI